MAIKIPPFVGVKDIRCYSCCASTVLVLICGSVWCIFSHSHYPRYFCSFPRTGSQIQSSTLQPLSHTMSVLLCKMCTSGLLAADGQRHQVIAVIGWLAVVFPTLKQSKQLIGMMQESLRNLVTPTFGKLPLPLLLECLKVSPINWPCRIPWRWTYSAFLVASSTYPVVLFKLNGCYSVFRSELFCHRKKTWVASLYKQWWDYWISHSTRSSSFSCSLVWMLKNVSLISFVHISFSHLGISFQFMLTLE